MRRKAVALTVIAATAFFALVSAGAGTATIRHCKTSDFKLREGPEASALGLTTERVKGSRCSSSPRGRCAG